MHDVAGWVHISFFDNGYITQFYLPSRSCNHLIPDVIDGGVSSVGYNTQLLFTGVDFTRVDNLVLRLQQACHLLRVYPHTGQFIDGYKDIHHFGLRAEQGYFHYPVSSDNLSFDTLCPVAHFFVRETVIAYQTVIDAEYITEIVRYRGNGSTGG